MERLLIQGGHEYLPFARSRIRVLKTLGMRYVSQTYTVNGVTINVSLENGNPVIYIRSNEMVGWTMNPNDGAGRYGYVPDPESGEQVPFEPEGLGEPDDDEDTKKTRNPYVFVRPDGRTQEETERLGGTHFWTNWAGERLLFGAGGTFCYKQKRLYAPQEGAEAGSYLYTLIATNGAIAKAETGKRIIFAVDDGQKTEFYSVLLSQASALPDLGFIDPYHKIGEVVGLSHQLQWKFSPDGLSAVAVEGRISSSSEAHTDTDFFRYTDATQSTFAGRQKIHRAAFTPADVDAGFTVAFTAEVVEDAIVKCVPTVSFVTRLMEREYVEYPAYVSRAKFNVTYSFRYVTPGSEFDPIGGSVVRGDGDPLLVGPYPSAVRTELVPEESNPSGAKYFVFDSGATPEVSVGVGVKQIGVSIDGTSEGWWERSPDFVFESTPDGGPLEQPEAIALIENANGADLFQKIEGVITGMTRVPGGISLDPAADLWDSWSAFNETMTLTVGRQSYRRDGEALNSPNMEAVVQKTFHILAPFDHLVNTHWERVVTFAYTGRRILDIDYTKDGTETRLELVGDDSSTVVCVQSDKTIIDEDDSTPPRRSASGNLFYDYTVQGTCRYALHLDGVEVANSQTQCEAERTSFMEDFTNPGGASPSFQVERFTAVQNVNESSFVLRGHDIRHGVILLEEVSSQYTENAERSDYGDSAGQLDRTRELFVFTKKEGKRSIEQYGTQSLTSSPVGYRHRMQHDGPFIRSITGNGLRAGNSKSLSGVNFIGSDFFTNGLPNQAGRDKFQALLPPECRDVGGVLGEYAGKYTKGWYRDSQAIQLSDRGWFFYETVVLNPTYRTMLAGEASLRRTQYGGDLFVIDPDKWLVTVRERFDGDEPYEKHRAYIGSKGKIKPYMPGYLDKDTALFDPVKISV